MSNSLSDALEAVPLRNAKAELRSGESPRRNLTCAGALIDLARKACGLEVKQMAALMGVSDSFLLRGFKDQEHISWQRLHRLPAAFHRELILLQAAELAGVEVITTVSFKRTA